MSWIDDSCNLLKLMEAEGATFLMLKWTFELLREHRQTTLQATLCHHIRIIDCGLLCCWNDEMDN